MELRKDYILDRWVIIAPGRGKRPQEFKKEIVSQEKGVCVFCPGNEGMTTADIGKVAKSDNPKEWLIRWFENKFAAVSLQGNFNIQTHNNYYTFADAFGRHEIIVETPEHNKQLGDLSVEHLKKVLDVYKNRIDDLSKIKGVKYVCVFKNEGPDAGASLRHSHTQVIAYDKVPTFIQEKVRANSDQCHYCSIIQREKDSLRRCFENEKFVAFTPYASRFSFEVWIFPKEHLTKLRVMDDFTTTKLAEMLRNILFKLKELNASYNMVLQHSPEGGDLHFHIEVLPRLSTWAGFELCSDTIINKVPPEDAAKFYRGESS
jgi:UDPglucose--hexose-1-phosphate uridylyltransferase